MAKEDLVRIVKSPSREDLELTPKQKDALHRLSLPSRSIFILGVHSSQLSVRDKLHNLLQGDYHDSVRY